MRTDTSEKLFQEACRVIPGGVNSPVRAWKAVGGNPRFIQRAAGSTVTDADGNTYLDYIGSWGPMILGHAHRAVLRAIQDALREGTSYGAPTAREIDLARSIVAAFPSIDLVRLVSSGTEASMTALRVARGFTGRSKVVKFAGCYHGHVDSLLVRAGSGALTLGSPDSAGVPAAVAEQTRVARFNDVAGVRELFATEGDDIAALIVEPVVGNMGVVPPRPGFLEGLREVTSRHGALLIFDEVMTGFRLAYGGVQTQTGIVPDLTCLGKVIGGGMPLAAVGGRREIMEKLAPLGAVYQAGTLSGNPLAVAAGIATLEQLESGRCYDLLEERGAALEEGLRAALANHSGPWCINRRGSMWTLFFGVEEVSDFESASRCDTRAYAAFFRAMLEQGVYLPPSAFEAAFLSLAHSDDDIAHTVAAARRAVERGLAS